MSPISPARKIQGGGMASYQRVNPGTLVTRKPGELAILLSLRHDSRSMDVPFTDRQWPGEYIGARDLAFRCLNGNQRHSYVAIPLDQPDPALESSLQLVVADPGRGFGHEMALQGKK